MRLTSLSGRTPAFGSPLSRPAVLITSRFVCDSCSFHHDSSAKLVLAYLTLESPQIFAPGTAVPSWSTTWNRTCASAASPRRSKGTIPQSIKVPARSAIENKLAINFISLCAIFQIPANAGSEVVKVALYGRPLGLCHSARH